MPTFVNKALTSSATAATTIVVTITPGTGNLITGLFSWGSTTTTGLTAGSTTSVIQTSTGQNVLVIDVVAEAGGPVSTVTWAAIVTGSPTSVTCTIPGGSTAFRIGTVQVWSGVSSATPDGHNLVSIQTAGTTMTSGSITTSAAGDLLVGYLAGAFAGNVTCTGASFSAAGTGSTLRNNDSTNLQGADSSEIQTAAGASTASFTLGSSAQYAVGIAAFKAAGATSLPTGTQPSTALPSALPPSPIDLRTWTWRQVDKLGKDKLPNRQQDWPNPVPPPKIDQTWWWRQTGMFGQDRLPNRQQDWPNPVPPPFADATWLHGFDQIRLTPRPTVYFDRPIYPPLIDETWAWSQTRMQGQDTLPFRQQDWPNPQPVPQIDRTWLQGFSNPLGTVVVLFPHNQYDWPNPLPAPQIDRTWTWTQTRMFGQDRLPFRQQDWPIPVPLPAIQQSWFSSAVLTIPPSTSAICQFDWHLPEGPPGIDRTWIQGFNPLLAAPQPRPLNQFDWPNPVPIPQIDRTQTWSQTRMLGQDTLPFRQQDWPPPPPLPNIDHSWVQPLTVLLATPIPPQPHNQFDWPNPLAPPSIDHFWMQQLLPLITPPPPPVFTGLPASNPFSALHNFGRLGST